MRTVLKERSRLPVGQCLEIAAVLAEALEHLHAHGLVHRDIKPSNIIFVNGRPKLADIGLVARADATLSFVGTEGYLPPEGPGKPPADIYSLGKVLYELASGKDRNQFPEPPTLLKELPDREAFQELNEVILKACAHDASERYQSAAEMQAELVSLRAGKSLKRSRLLEKRLAQLTKLSVAGVSLTMLVIASYFYQQYQTRVARQLVRQNELQVAQLHEKDGLRLMEEGDLIGSLPWFAEALTRAQGDAQAEQRHRLQIGTILQQCPRLLQFIHEPGFVTGAEFCADGHRVVTTGVLPNHQQYISAWNLADGTLIRRIDTGVTRAGPNVRMSLSSDDYRVVVWSSRPDSREAFVYDLRTGGRIGKPLAHEESLVQATFTPDGRLVLTASTDRTARLWNPDTGECVTTMEHSTGVRSAVIDSAGETILTVGEDGRAHLWNAQSGQQMTGMDLGTRVASLTDRLAEFSPDGQRAVLAADGETQVWNVRKGTRLTTVKTTGLGYVVVGFSPDGELILISGFDDKASRTAQVWEAATGEPVPPPLDKRLGWWGTLRFAPDGAHVLSGGERFVTTMWDARSGENVWPPVPANSQLAWFGNGVRFSPDGRMALIVSRSGVQVWDLTGAASGLPFVRHNGSVQSLAFSPDGQWLVSASEDRTARVWETRTALPVSPPLHHDGAVVRARFTSDGSRVLTASHDGTAQLWNAKTGEKILPPLQHGAPLQEAKFSPDGKWIMTVANPLQEGGNGLVRLWNSSTGAEAGEAIDHGDRFRLIAEFTPDSRRVITTSGPTVQPWRVPNGERIGEPEVWPLQSGSDNTFEVRIILLTRSGLANRLA
ncbi:MAG: protein kinase [Verrucomicrobia bacterium]|nr:protein kinase [Verrucomicrobiota bacterium]